MRSDHDTEFEIGERKKNENFHKFLYWKYLNKLRWKQ